MSRLFSRLENTGQGRSDAMPLPEQSGPDLQPEGAAPLAGPTQAGATPLTSGASTMAPLVPRYSISAHLSTPLAAPMASKRPDWGVRLWLFSLLLLIALALLMLALPERLYPLSLQRQAPEYPLPNAAPVARVQEPAPIPIPVPAPGPAASRPASPPAALPTRAEPAPAPAPAPAPPTARAEPRTTPAPGVRAPVKPASPGIGAAACSEAMLALNLCTLPPP